MTNYECENRISDDEIISSLNVVATTRNCSECKIRNCKWGDCNCSQITDNTALGLINRQNAEIERLQKEANLVSIQFQDMQERYEAAQAEIERLNNIKFGADLSIGSIKTEAIKEFAEKLKKRFYLCAGRCVVNVYHIDNLLKEYEKGR